MNMTTFKKVKLGEVCDVRDGTHDSPKQSSTGYPLVTSKHILNSRVDVTETYLISEKDFENINKRSKVDLWDILFSMIGTVGEIALIKSDDQFAIKNVGLIKTGDKRLGKYLFYYLHSPRARNDLQSLLTGSTQKFISLGKLRDFPVLLPPDAIQSQIISVLSAYDDLIENNEKRIKALEEMAQLLYTEWFVKFKFPVNSPPSEGWQAKPDGVVPSPPEAGCLKGGVVSPRNTQNYMSLPYNPKLKERAKELRKAGNLSEVLFWQQVKNGQFKGFDFDRQKIIGNYIVDFYCSLPRQASPATPSKKGNNSPPVEGCPQGGVVIEIDGSSHDDKQDYDKERDTYLSSLGLTVVHILDSEVKRNLEGVMVWLNDHPAFQAPVQELPPRLSGTPPKEGNNSPSLKGWQAKPDGVVGYKDAGGKMVDSGTEYGMIPEGWEVKRLGDISFEKRDSINPKKIDPNTPYVGLEHIPRRSIILNEWGLTKEVSSSKLIFKVGDILFGKIRPYFHKVVSAPIDGIASSDTIVISPSDEKYRALVRAYVSSVEFVAYSTKTSQGTKMPRADWKTLAKYSVLVPDDYVANLFNRICNTAINKMNCLMLKNRNLQSIRDLLILQLVTGKREVK